MELAAQLDPQSSQIFHTETCDHFVERQKAAEINVSGNMWLLNVSSKSCPRPMKVHVTSSLFTCQGHGKAAAVQGGSMDCEIWNHTWGFGAKSLWLQTPADSVGAANRNHPGHTSPLLPGTQLQPGPWGLQQCCPPLWSPVENWTSWLCLEREEGLSYWKVAGMSTDQSYPETQHWKILEEEIAENSFYPLDKTQQDDFFLFLRLLFAMILEGLSLWVCVLSPGGREWMRSNCAMILHPAGLGYPLTGWSSPIQHVWTKLFFLFQDFWLTHSYSPLVCPFVYPCFIFIFWRSRCLEGELMCLKCCIISSHLQRIFCPRRVFSILFSLPRFFFWEMPSRICQSLFAISAEFLGCKKRIFKLVAIVRIDKTLSGKKGLLRRQIVKYSH